MRVLLAVDYSSGSDRGVEEFAERPWPVDTTVRVLVIVENIPPSAAELWFDAGGSLEAVLQARREKAEELVLPLAFSMQPSHDIAALSAIRFSEKTFYLLRDPILQAARLCSGPAIGILFD